MKTWWLVERTEGGYVMLWNFGTHSQQNQLDYHILGDER